jgi:hypothetical protein
LAFIASLTALLMSSRSMGIILVSAGNVDLGGSVDRDNRRCGRKQSSRPEICGKRM